MENRSFDHLLGWLEQDRNSSIDGLTGHQKVPRNASDHSYGYVQITRRGYDVSLDDPLHDFDSVALQIDNGPMDGFVECSIMNKLNETNPVSMFDINSAPIINNLALEYAVFDRWFASIPGPTDPNRGFAMTGTSLGMVDNFNGTLWP